MGFKLLKRLLTPTEMDCIYLLSRTLIQRIRNFETSFEIISRPPTTTVITISITTLL
jgi:hypothetical protein